MWTPEHREKYKPITSRYTSDLSDAEYEVLEKFVPKYLRQRAHSLREILNGLFYILRNGVTYRNVPKDLPPRSTLHRWLQRFDEERIFDRMLQSLTAQDRQKNGRNPSPSGSVMDTESLKTTPTGSLKGYDGGKCVKGMKRFYLVDTDGRPLYFF